MSLYGVAGFPLMDGIPRGQSFVDFMRSRDSAPSGHPPVSSAPPIGLTPGAFDENASSTILSRAITDMGQGLKQVETTRKFSDGSTRASTFTQLADGMKTWKAERRSMVDAEGFEKVRVVESVIAADGTREVNVRVFRVPAGMDLDWNSSEAQQYFSHTTSKTIPPGLTWHDVPPNSPPQNVEMQPPSQGRPVIPLAT